MKIVIVLIFLIANIPVSNAEDKMIKKTFVKGSLAVRMTRTPKKGETVILAIPGGPGITGRYLDEMVNDLAEATKRPAMLVDLPNHDQSTRQQSDTSGDIRYSEVKSMLINMIQELESGDHTVVIVAHSLGALIAYDLVMNGFIACEKLVLVSMPIKLERSPEFAEYLSNIGALSPQITSEPEFAKWWKQILPGYFFESPSRSNIELLTTRTYWRGNDHFTDGLPAALPTELVNSYHNKIIYIEGEKEWVLPQNNYEMIRKLLPGVSLSKLLGAGHFPMLEKREEFLKVVTPFIQNCTDLLVPSLTNKGVK